MRSAPQRPAQHRTSIDEVLLYISAKIQAAEREVHRCQAATSALESMKDRSLPEFTEKVMEMTQWMSRRRTLIEIWEFSSNQVWVSPYGKKAPERPSSG